MNNPEIDFVIKDKLEKLFIVCLENAGVYREYTDEQLAQSTFVLQEVFMAKMYKYNKNKLTTEQQMKLAKEAGRSLHQTILLFTGVDLHTINK